MIAKKKAELSQILRRIEKLGALHRLRPTQITDGMFDKQREVLRDPSPRKAIVCGRRAGKTTLGARLLQDSAQRNPASGEDESITCYIAPTKNQARRLMWGRLQVVAKKQGLPFEFNSTELIARHANGAQVWLMGADDNRDADRLRGFAFRRVIIDEAQSVGADFEELISEIIEPALADWDGDLVLTGTPSAACCGYFHDASTGKLPDWTTSTWTVLDNSGFPRWRGNPDWQAMAAEWIVEVRNRKGWPEDHPTFQREWLGRWVRDEAGLIYRYQDGRNTYEGQAPTGLKHVIGVDLGFDDAFAVCVLGFDPKKMPDLWEVDGYEKSGQTPSEWAEVLRTFNERYKPERIVVDTGGLGKAITTEFSQRYGLPVQPAQKANKFDFIALVNADFERGSVHLQHGGHLANQAARLQWDEDHKKEDPRFPNHRLDAFLYAWRESRHWLHVEPDFVPDAGSPEYFDRVREAMRQAAVKKTKKKDWWTR